MKDFLCSCLTAICAAALVLGVGRLLIYLNSL